MTDKKDNTNNKKIVVSLKTFQSHLENALLTSQKPGMELIKVMDSLVRLIKHYEEIGK